MRGHSRSPAGARRARPAAAGVGAACAGARRRRAAAGAGAGGARPRCARAAAHGEGLARLDGDLRRASRPRARAPRGRPCRSRPRPRICSAATASPTATRHSTTTPSVTDSMSGRTIVDQRARLGGRRAGGAASAGGLRRGAGRLGLRGGALRGRGGRGAVARRRRPRAASSASSAPDLHRLARARPRCAPRGRLAGAGTSTSTLSVVTSSRVSPGLDRRRPRRRATRPRRPSVTDSPSSGSSTWMVWEEVVDTRTV